jgi:proteasome lid subunit RPN8/RPN11
MKLAINKTAYAVMLAHCQAEYPLEACGFLGGQDGKAFAVTAVENILRSPVAYEMDPRQQIEAMLHIENGGLDLMAAFHSHPQGPSQPSATDLAQAYYPELVQIIISLRERTAPVARAFLLTHDEFNEVELLVV